MKDFNSYYFLWERLESISFSHNHRVGCIFSPFHKKQCSRRETEFKADSL